VLDHVLDHGDRVQALAWGPDGRLASGGGGLRVWPAGGGPPQLLDHGGLAQRDEYQVLAWAPDGRLAGGGGMSVKVSVWPAGGGSPQLLDNGQMVQALAWGPDGRLVSGGRDGEVRIWQVSSHSDQLPGLQLPQSEFRFDRPCDALAVWSDRIACAINSLALLRIIANSEPGTGI
jgi:WD40 repeat protein